MIRAVMTAATRARKSERLHILVDAKFKRFLRADAKRAGLSIADASGAIRSGGRALLR